MLFIPLLHTRSPQCIKEQIRTTKFIDETHCNQNLVVYQRYTSSEESGGVPMDSNLNPISYSSASVMQTLILDIQTKK